MQIKLFGNEICELTQKKSANIENIKSEGMQTTPESYVRKKLGRLSKVIYFIHISSTYLLGNQNILI